MCLFWALFLAVNGKGCPIKSSPKGKRRWKRRENPNTNMTKLAQKKNSSQSKSVKLSRTMRGKPATAYRLPDDGRKWKHSCNERKQLADWLATYGDADGTHIFPSIRTMLAAFDTWSHGKLFYRLADLRRLGVLESEGLKGERGPRIRRLRPDKLANQPGVQDSDSDEIELAEVQDTQY